MCLKQVFIQTGWGNGPGNNQNCILIKETSLRTYRLNSKAAVFQVADEKKIMLHKSAWMILRYRARIKIRQLLSNLSTTPSSLSFPFAILYLPASTAPLLLCPPLTPAPGHHAAPGAQGADCRMTVSASCLCSCLFLHLLPIKRYQPQSSLLALFVTAMMSQLPYKRKLSF